MFARLGTGRSGEPGERGWERGALQMYSKDGIASENYYIHMHMWIYMYVYIYIYMYMYM